MGVSSKTMVQDVYAVRIGGVSGLEGEQPYSELASERLPQVSSKIHTVSDYVDQSLWDPLYIHGVPFQHQQIFGTDPELHIHDHHASLGYEELHAHFVLLVFVVHHKVRSGSAYHYVFASFAFLSFPHVNPVVNTVNSPVSLDPAAVDVHRQALRKLVL